MFDKVLKIFLLLSPIFVFKDYKVGMARGMFFIIGIFVLFAIGLISEQKRKLKIWHITAFLLLALVRVFFDGVPSQEWFNFWFSCGNFIYVFCGVLLFYLVVCYSGDAKQFLIPILAVSIINLIVTSFQLFDINLVWKHSYVINGMMESHSQLGQYSAMALPLMFFVHPLLAVVPTVTLLLSKSVSPIFSCFLGLCFLSYSFKKWIVLALIILVGMGLFLSNYHYVKAKFTCSRPQVWTDMVKEIFKRPFLGHGYSTFTEKVLKVKKNVMGRNETRRAHNDYAHLALELGAPIVIIFCMFIYNIFKKFFFKKDKNRLTYCLSASVLIILINMSGQTTLRYASIAGTWIVLLALLCVRLEGNYD